MKSKCETDRRQRRVSRSFAWENIITGNFNNNISGMISISWSQWRRREDEREKKLVKSIFNRTFASSFSFPCFENWPGMFSLRLLIDSLLISTPAVVNDGILSKNVFAENIIRKVVFYLQGKLCTDWLHESNQETLLLLLLLVIQGVTRFEVWMSFFVSLGPVFPCEWWTIFLSGYKRHQLPAVNRKWVWLQCQDIQEGSSQRREVRGKTKSVFFLSSHDFSLLLCILPSFCVHSHVWCFRPIEWVNRWHFTQDSLELPYDFTVYVSATSFMSIFKPYA